MNGLLFCVFTKSIRQRLYQSFARWLCCCCKSRAHSFYKLEPSTSRGLVSRSHQFEDTTNYEPEDDKVFGEGVAVNQSGSSGQGLLKWMSGRKQGTQGALTSSSRLLSDSVNGFGYQSLSFGKSVGPEWLKIISSGIVAGVYLALPSVPVSVSPLSTFCNTAFASF